MKHVSSMDVDEGYASNKIPKFCFLSDSAVGLIHSLGFKRSLIGVYWGKDFGYGWGIPSATISDRDPKFMSDFWYTIFEKMGTSILASAAWHPQTDGQSERTNQTVEIALRFFVIANPVESWLLALPYFQGLLNNSSNQSTGVSPNEITRTNTEKGIRRA